MPLWWFVRHGESMAQATQWTGPEPDIPLSPLGEEQADALVDTLAVLPIQRVLVSPYLRARETARRAMSGNVLPHTVLHPLHERLSGDWREWFATLEEADARMATWDFRPHGGESILDATVRALRALHEHEAPHNTIVFAHGRLLAGLLTAIDDADTTRAIMPTANCAVDAREIAPGTWGRLLNALSQQQAASGQPLL